MNNSALLVMDYQIDILKNVESKAKYLLANTSALLAAARKSNTPIFFVKVG
ncbi:MAG: isochorismatase family protein, partial [Bdellovibrionota bacterium]